MSNTFMEILYAKHCGRSPMYTVAPLFLPRTLQHQYQYYLYFANEESETQGGKLKSSYGFLGDTVVKNSPANGGDEGSISGQGRSPKVGNGNPLQYSCLENSMDRRA